VPPVGFLEGVIYYKYLTMEGIESKKPPREEWLFDIFKFPKVEVGELDQVKLIDTSTPKI